MQNLKLVIFDMDGLIFDTERIAYQALRRVLKDDHEIDFPIKTYKRMIGMGPSKTESIFQEVYGDKFSFKQLIPGYRENLKNILDTEGIATKKGITPLLDHLDKKGIKRCIASSSSLKTIENYLSLSSLTDRFDFYLSGDEVEHGKPAPDIFLEACRRADESPEHALVLEDSVHGFNAAQSAQIPCIVIPDLIEATTEMKENAYRVLSDLEKVIDLV